MQEVAAGIDIGGTKIALGLVDEQGALLASTQLPTLVSNGPQAGIERIVSALDGLLAQSPEMSLQGIGVGCTGPLDAPRGIIQNPFTLPGWEDFNLLMPLGERYGVPTHMENDADAAALGEAWRGSGQGYRTQVYITVSTGIGAGLILNGRLYKGSGNAGELGHAVVEIDGPLCNCGRRGCLEAIAAGPALIQLALGGDEPGKVELLRHDPLTPAHITAAARAGNPHAQAVIARAARALGVGVANAVACFAPDAIVLGGGVMQEWDLFIDAIDAEVAKAVGMIYVPSVPVLHASLEIPGMIGAARLIWEPDIIWK